MSNRSRKKPKLGRSTLFLAVISRGLLGAQKHDPRPKRQRTRAAQKRAALRDN